MTYRTLTNGDKTPPSVTRKFVAMDDGNCSPRYLRATTHHVPLTRETAAMTKLPIALICRPLAPPEEGEVRGRGWGQSWGLGAGRLAYLRRRRFDEGTSGQCYCRRTCPCSVSILDFC